MKRSLFRYSHLYVLKVAVVSNRRSMKTYGCFMCLYSIPGTFMKLKVSSYTRHNLCSYFSFVSLKINYGNPGFVIETSIILRGVNKLFPPHKLRHEQSDSKTLSPTFFSCSSPNKLSLFTSQVVFLLCFT